MMKVVNRCQFTTIYEWYRGIPLPLTNSKHILVADTNCGEVVLKKDTLPWQALAVQRMMMDNEREDSDSPTRDVQRR